MSLMKMTLLLRQSSPAPIGTQGAVTPGWSETFYHDGLDPISLLSAGALLARARMALAPASLLLDAVRFSDPNARRTAHLELPAGPAQLPYNGTYPAPPNVFPVNVSSPPVFAQEPAAESRTALLFRMEAIISGETRAHREFQMRGLPEQVVTGNNYVWNSRTWRNRISAFIRALLGKNADGGTSTEGAWQLKCEDPSQPVANCTLSPASGINLSGPSLPNASAINPNNFLVVTSTLNLNANPFMKNVAVPGAPIQLTTIQPGDLIQLSGLRGGRAVNGNWRVYATQFAVAPFTMTLGPSRRPYGLPQFPGLCRLSYVRWVGYNIIYADDERLSSRTIGRPFGQPRGRRSGR